MQPRAHYIIYACAPEQLQPIASKKPQAILTGRLLQPLSGCYNHCFSLLMVLHMQLDTSAKPRSAKCFGYVP